MASSKPDETGSWAPNTPSSPSTPSPAPTTATTPAAPISPARQAAALDISRQRKIHTKPDANGRWRAYTGDSTALGDVDYDDPVEALEAAEIALAAKDSRATERQLAELIESLKKGIFMPWPTHGASGIIEWSVLTEQGGNDQVVSGPFAGLVPALIEVERLTKIQMESRPQQGSSPDLNPKD